MWLMSSMHLQSGCILFPKGGQDGGEGGEGERERREKREVQRQRAQPPEMHP